MIEPECKKKKGKKKNNNERIQIELHTLMRCPSKH